MPRAIRQSRAPPRAALDTQVRNVGQADRAGATPVFTRTYYTDFTDVAQPEEYIEANANSVCDNGESYEDANGNGVWDADRGRNGRGGARDAVLYKVTVSYPRLFPVASFIGQSNNTSMTAIAVLRNQPYGFQNIPTQTRTCP